jgi:hypothetical protein
LIDKTVCVIGAVVTIDNGTPVNFSVEIPGFEGKGSVTKDKTADWKTQVVRTSILERYNSIVDTAERWAKRIADLLKKGTVALATTDSGEKINVCTFQLSGKDGRSGRELLKFLQKHRKDVAFATDKDGGGKQFRIVQSNINKIIDVARRSKMEKIPAAMLSRMSDLSSIVRRTFTGNRGATNKTYEGSFLVPSMAEDMAELQVEVEYMYLRPRARSGSDSDEDDDGGSDEYEDSNEEGDEDGSEEASSGEEGSGEGSE